MRQNTFAAGALPRTPLGELTALPRPLSWIWGRGIWKRNGKDYGKGTEGRGKELRRDEK